MIDPSGYLKLTDFGSSKYIPITDKTRSMVGTPEYIAPEMILCREYNRSVDLWQLGVFIFELLTRSTPYQHNNLVSYVTLLFQCGYLRFAGDDLQKHCRNRRSFNCAFQ
jgi:serine/threonine protein kinase